MGIDITSSFIHLHGFYLLVLLPLFVETTDFTCANKVDLLCVRPGSGTILMAAKAFLNFCKLWKFCTP